MLLNQGAGIGARDKTGATALHIASQEGQTGAVESLIANSANANLVDIYERTALLWAVEKGAILFDERRGEPFSSPYDFFRTRNHSGHISG